VPDQKISQLNALTSLTADDLLVVVNDPSGSPETMKMTAANFQSEINLWKRVLLPADVTNDNAVANTIQDVTGLAFTVVSGRIYWFKFFIWFTSAASGTGSRWSLNSPNADRLSYQSHYSLSTTTQTLNARVATVDSPAASNTTSAATVTNYNSTTGGHAILEGVIVPSAGGSVIARFASEVSSSAIIAKVGSFVEYTEIIP
jgi:hypothetical protein